MPQYSLGWIFVFATQAQSDPGTAQTRGGRKMLTLPHVNDSIIVGRTPHCAIKYPDIPIDRLSILKKPRLAGLW